jgi:hypothetical protein
VLNENNIRLPIVEHNEKLKGCIDEIEKVGGSKQEIQNGKNFIYQTRIDLSNLERMERESAGDNTKLLLDETARMEKEFKRLSDVEGGTLPLRSRKQLPEAADPAAERREVQNQPERRRPRRTGPRNRTRSRHEKPLI